MSGAFSISYVDYSKLNIFLTGDGRANLVKTPNNKQMMKR